MNDMDEDGWNIDHYADTTEGQSGSGLYIISNGNRYVIGNHYAGFEHHFDSWNEARRLSDTFYSYLISYTAL
jgi:V8-like Glu-specific endopeptidase